jgi:hypothetical protein
MPHLLTEHYQDLASSGLTSDVIEAFRFCLGRTDLTLRVVVTAGMQPVAVAVIEVKKDTLPPGRVSSR